jgi:hypothetical protein
MVTRTVRRRIGMPMAALVAIAAFGLVSREANAQCGLHAPCSFDSTRTASLTVIHQTTDPLPVVPDDTDTWNITATWTLESPPGNSCVCSNRTTMATVDVTRSGSGWSATCTSGCGGSSPIVQVSVCNATTSGCQEQPGPVAYELIVDLVANHTFLCFVNPHVGKLVAVDFESTSVDDGDVIEGNPC